MIPEPTKTPAAAGSCPHAQGFYSHSKTIRLPGPTPQPPITIDDDGTWHIHDFALARAVLRSSDVRQAGFMAEMFAEIAGDQIPPVLFQDGDAHRDQRTAIARFFTPRTVSTAYDAMMQQYADEIVAELVHRGSADLSRLTMKLAVNVAARVVGLTNSILPGMSRRLDAFFAGTDPGELSWRSPRSVWRFVRAQTDMLQFFWFDVKPAIRARRRQRQEDVISHLLDNEYSEPEILIECVTYGAAGMVTTREFICMAVWHLLEQPELRERYLAGDQDTRYHILHEILRLEPVVGHLRRRATADVTLSLPDGDEITIPAGTLIDLHIDEANVDPTVVGECPYAIGLERQMKRVPSAALSFGDGAHRCPGAYIAIQETDILLTRLLQLETLHIVSGPRLQWGAITQGYELREFVVEV